MFELGVENGRYYSLNVPLRDGIDDQGWSFVGIADWTLFLEAPVTLKPFFHKLRLKQYQTELTY